MDCVNFWAIGLSNNGVDNVSQPNPPAAIDVGGNALVLPAYGVVFGSRWIHLIL